METLLAVICILAFLFTMLVFDFLTFYPEIKKQKQKNKSE